MPNWKSNGTYHTALQCTILHLAFTFCRKCHTAVQLVFFVRLNTIIILTLQICHATLQLVVWPWLCSYWVECQEAWHDCRGVRSLWWRYAGISTSTMIEDCSKCRVVARQVATMRCASICKGWLQLASRVSYIDERTASCAKRWISRALESIESTLLIDVESWAEIKRYTHTRRASEQLFWDCSGHLQNCLGGSLFLWPAK